jgi:predicted nucleotidyltransferase
MLWFAFRDARADGRAVGWLADHGLVGPAAAQRNPKRGNVLKVVETAAADLRALYGERVRQILLFGSWARGDADPESDIDLLVVLDQVDSPWEELRRMDEILWRHSFRNDVVISAVPVGEDELHEPTRPFVIRAQTEGRPIP